MFHLNLDAGDACFAFIQSGRDRNALLSLVDCEINEVETLYHCASMMPKSYRYVTRDALLPAYLSLNLDPV
jgi:hypothetical protein